MKKILALLFLSAAIISCETEPLDPSLNSGATGGSGSGSGSGSVDTTLIVGSWDYADTETESTTTSVVMGNTISLTVDIEFVSSDAVLVFNTDGTYTVDGDLTIETFLAGASQGQSTSTLAESGTYTINGSNITFAANGAGTVFDANAVYTIVELTATDLEITVASDVTQVISGVSQRTEIEGFASFTR
ncbi:hypothetical protein [Nonlabens sp. Asnod2-A12]|uniref:hypothetical protein n=1 Tax=Nonlabens sp. Asnod2-A12 TaxID=3160578 RepID=UPI003865756B